MDELEFEVIEPLDQLSGPSAELRALHQTAEGLKLQLEAVDARLFQRLRANIQIGEYRGADFMQMIREYVGEEAFNAPADIGYSPLDFFLHELLFSDPLPQETLVREPDMVGYQPTPAHIVFDLIEKARLTREDIFFDLGSGLGQVSLLVHLLSGVAVRGLEVEPTFCQYARACAEFFHFPHVVFLEADARKADYSDGTVFFLYTPFMGKMLEEVLGQLRQVSQTRPIKVFTYGPCTPIVAKQKWLMCLENGAETYKLGMFFNP